MNSLNVFLFESLNSIIWITEKVQSQIFNLLEIVCITLGHLAVALLQETDSLI